MVSAGAAIVRDSSMKLICFETAELSMAPESLQPSNNAPDGASFRGGSAASPTSREGVARRPRGLVGGTTQRTCVHLGVRRWAAPRWTLWASVAFLLAEGAGLLVGRGSCPVAPLQAEWGDPVPFFELVLPPRAAKAAVPVLAVVSLTAIAGLVVRRPGLVARA